MDRIEFSNLGIMDVVSISAQHHTCVVLPTLDHAIEFWPRYRQAIFDRHTRKRCKPTKTAVYMDKTKTILRLWVPYDRDPTMPLDWRQFRHGFVLVSPYSRRETR